MTKLIQLVQTTLRSKTYNSDRTMNRCHTKLSIYNHDIMICLLFVGGRPRTLPIPGWDLKNVFVLRTPDDANAIAKQAKGRNVVIFGASFIGMELASALIQKARSVSVCEFFSVPFERVLGNKVCTSYVNCLACKFLKLCYYVCSLIFLLRICYILSTYLNETGYLVCAHEVRIAC